MKSKAIAFPYVGWMALFVAAPLVIITIYAFTSDAGGFTLSNFLDMAQYTAAFGRSFLLAAIATVICVLIGYPFGYAMGKASRKWRTILMLLVIVPFWTNALIRIYGWRILLAGNGPVNALLVSLGIVDKPLKLLNTHGAVVLGMVYALLPFMILPVYTSVEKMDWSLVDAGHDLGANAMTVFRTVTLPITASGLLTGSVLVFVPSLALFFMSDLMGGPSDILIGNLVNDQLLKSRDWPFAAALSVVLLGLTGLIMFVYRKLGGKSSDMTVF